MARRAGLATLALTLAAAALAAAAGPAAARGCVTRLPVSGRLASPFAAAATTQVKVIVSDRGPAVRFLRAQIYTFDGIELARGNAPGTVRSTRTVRLKTLAGPIQVGRYTLVLTGEPNRDRSCGPKQRFRIVRFRPCLRTLPVTLPRAPGGLASDYEDFLSFDVRATAGAVRNLRASVSSFAGELFGTAQLPALFGTARMDIELTRRLDPGSYTLFLQGDVDQPPSCGTVSAKQVLTFG